MTAEQARDVLESVNAFHPLGRHGVPADVVEAILFLAGPRAGVDHGHDAADRRRRARRPQRAAGARRRVGADAGPPAPDGAMRPGPALAGSDR